jgi:hemerythrin-like domain-containing protein
MLYEDLSKGDFEKYRRTKALLNLDTPTENEGGFSVMESEHQQLECLLRTLCQAYGAPKEMLDKNNRTLVEKCNEVAKMINEIMI